MLYLWLVLGVLSLVGSSWGSLFYYHDNKVTSIRTAPVPYNGHFLHETHTGLKLLTSKQLIQTYFNNTDVKAMTDEEMRAVTGNQSFVLLCNISAAGSSFDLSCPVSLMKLATVVLSMPDSTFPNDPGRNLYFLDDLYVDTIFMETSLRDYATLWNWTNYGNSTLLNVTITPEGHNPWTDAYTSAGWIFLQVFMCLFCAFCIVLACYNFFQSNWRKKFPQISHICLLIEIAGSLFRFIWFATDPISSHRLFRNASIAGLFQVVPFAFCMLGSLLVSLFWFGLLRQNHIPTAGLEKRLRKPVYIVSGLLTLLTVASVISLAILPRGSPTISKFTITCTTVYAVLGVFIFGFYIYTGVRIVRFLSEQQQKAQSEQVCSEREKERLKKIVKLVSSSAVVMFLLEVCAVLFLIPAIGSNMTGYLTMWGIEAFLLALLSFIQIMGFLPNKHKITKTDTATTASGTNSLSVPITTP